MSAELYLLIIMCYDCYVSICKSLHYGALMDIRAWHWHIVLSEAPSLDLLVSVLYSVVLPDLSPLFYSLRNQELMEFMRKVGSVE
ncbi:olfactory receptor 5H17-like [Agelaius phoeniceus]|uniref:olfactory receptor 5H17-like n=1 Tax=Agelaius phoeniceus TaxID=39638 RepID=UPI0040550646